MTDRTFEVLLVEDNPGDADLVREVLADSDGAGFHLHVAQTLLAGLDRLARGDIDAVLLDLSLPDSSGLDTITTLRADAANVPLIVLTGVNSEAIGLQAMQHGAQDYLVKGTFGTHTLTRALRYAIARQSTLADQLKSATQAKPASMIGVLGAKGGVGTTTIACHLSRELRRQTAESLLLADLDFQATSLGLLMKADSPHSMLDAAGKIQHLDQNCWRSLIAHGTDEVDVILSPGPQNLEKHPKAETVRHVLRLVRRYHTWVVLDLGRPGLLSLSLIPDLASLLLVTTPDLLALCECKAILRKLADFGIPPERIRLTLNHVHPDQSGFTARDLEKVAGQPVALSLPEAYADLCDASMDGRLLRETSGFREGLADCAAAIAGLERKKSAPKFSMPWFGSAGAETGRTRPQH